jgi:uncharacterized protein YkwD
MPVSRSRQLFGLALVAVALLWQGLGDRIQAAVTPDRSGCPHSSDLPHPDRLAEARAAVLCLLNQARVAHGLPALAEAPRLQQAAQEHAADMGRRDFYAHRNPDGVDPDQRIRATGYEGRTTGENIHWGVGLHATPAHIVEDWMHSPGHRANILRPAFTHVGTGIGYDAPQALFQGDAGVYVNDFAG